MKKTSRAGVSDTRAGLQPAGLFSSAGIFKKGFQDFHPLDESPYLLFDAQTSMLGNLENPTLDLDASKAETLDVITTTRSGIATFTAADGQIVTADPNTVRVDWSLGYPAMLIEPSATNFVENSSSFIDIGEAVTTFGIDAPDGSTDAKRISNAQVVNGSFVRCATTTVPTGSAIELSGSAYIRGVAGETVRVLMKRISAGPYVASSTQTIFLTGDWQRIENLTLTTDPANNRMAIYVNSDEATADTIDLWGAQIEEGSVSTSFIPTSGSTVTRQADDLVIDGSNFADFYNQSEGTIYVEANGRVDSTGNYLFNIKDSTINTNAIRSRFNSGNYFQIRVNDSNLASISQGALTLGTVNRVSGSYKSTNAKGSVNGSVEQSVTISSVPSGLIEMRIGSYITNNFYLNGHIKRLIYWPTHSDSL